MKKFLKELALCCWAMYSIMFFLIGVLCVDTFWIKTLFFLPITIYFYWLHDKINKNTIIIKITKKNYEI